MDNTTEKYNGDIDVSYAPFDYYAALELGLPSPEIKHGMFCTIEESAMSPPVPYLCEVMIGACRVMFMPTLNNLTFDKYIRNIVDIKYRVVKGVTTISVSYKGNTVTAIVPLDNKKLRIQFYQSRLHQTIRYCGVAAVAGYYLKNNLNKE